MELHASPHSSTVSNLMPTWEDAATDGGGSFEPEQIERPRTFAYDLLREDDVDAWPEAREVRRPMVAAAAAGTAPDYDDLRRRDIARELLRARLVALAEQREHRSAYEIVFIMLAAAVAILLAAPPLVQVLLAAHGTQA